ncbi:unnamed protein product [Danaus chrysippus]|uniref:(African queen) hypothetical protein n=1 Tax=Danaus chrysippus TaxID=151541 RepID=A0A8J2QF96_9NEOP|nr:unnamed protein product [Danaus chrysippus]
MSKENNNLRLLGSPVNLTYRNKRKEDRKNTRNRPRSALQNSSSPDVPERYKRPFSADTKDRGQSTRSFYKTFSADLLQSYNNSPLSVKVLPPTEDLLTHSNVHITRNESKEISSNASDYGSEDTFISLGTKIKAKAQTGCKNRNTNPKNFLKYRNIAKKGRKSMESLNEINDNYGLEITIKEKSGPLSPNRNSDFFPSRSSSPCRNKSYESYFLALEEVRNGDGIVGRVSFAPANNKIGKNLDNPHRLGLTKQQLSLVEEESAQDIDSIPSQNTDNLSIKETYDCKEISNIDINYDKNDKKTLLEDNKDYNSAQNYNAFYDDIHSNTPDSFNTRLSSTGIHTDSSKDSGYPESVNKEHKTLTQNYLLTPTPNSYDFNSKTNPTKNSEYSTENDKAFKTNNKWSEPWNHSRLLYKDFFLKKETHVPAPQNTPTKNDVQIPGTNENIEEDTDKLEYPTYLLNSSTKAYTSKVIEDYRKELEAINTLHELTVKDIKIDPISPTPLSIDEMFEQHSNRFNDGKTDLSENSQESTNNSDSTDKNSLNNKRDISKVPTRELIQNYFKVKGDCTKEFPRNAKKYDKKLNNINPKYEENSSYKQYWNNRNAKNSIERSKTPVDVKSQNKAVTARAPSSARIESVQNDKDIESWMSLSAPSPRLLETDNVKENITELPKTETVINKIEENEAETHNQRPKTPEAPKPKELDSKSTIVDIYSMLKEIESFGDNPVTNIDEPNEPKPKQEDRCSTPKDNFMEIFEFLEKVEQSANDALSVVTNTTPQTIPKLEALLKLPQTELAQRLVTLSLQLEERSCCIALLQESLANHKEQMINKVSNLEKQSHRNIAKVKQECEETIKRHQNFIDQLINDKKTLNHRIEQLVDERRTLEERWKRSAQTLEERYKLELRNQHDKMAAAQQVARQRWVRQKAEKIKELTVKGLEGELREMAERQQKEISDLKMFHAEQCGRMSAKHANDLEELRRSLEEEKESALIKERQLASSRLERQLLELELSQQEQRARLADELRAEGERLEGERAAREREQREQMAKWKEEQEKLLDEKKQQIEKDIAKEREKFEEELKKKRLELEEEFNQYKKEYEADQQVLLMKKVTEIATQHKLERDREIERAIESMESEAQAGRRELQEALRRNKEQYEIELKELAETEQATLKRYQDAQARIRSTEDKCEMLKILHR